MPSGVLLLSLCPFATLPPPWKASDRLNLLATAMLDLNGYLGPDKNESYRSLVRKSRGFLRDWFFFLLIEV